MSASSKTKTKKKSKTPTNSSSKAKTRKKNTKRSSALQKLLDSQKTKSRHIETDAFGIEITYNSNDELTGIRQKKQQLSNIIWSFAYICCYKYQCKNHSNKKCDYL